MQAPVWASGFQTTFHSVSSFSRGLGGAGVSGDDLADIYYNPAAASLYEGTGFQIYAGSGNVENTFNNLGSTQTLAGSRLPNVGLAQGLDEDFPGASFQFTKKLDSGALKGWTAGLALGNAFGNQTEYPVNWVGRRHAVDSQLTVLDFNPVLSYQVSPTVTIGGGLSIQRSDATLSQATFTGTPVEPVSTLEGSDTAIGFDIGATISAGKNRFGLSYRSQVEHTLEGTLTAPNPANLSLQSLPAQAEITFPETVYISGVFPVSEKTTLSWTSRWTRWSRNQEIRITDPSGLQTFSLIPQNWGNTWLHGVGVDHRVNSVWKFRLGLMVDSTPIPSPELRTPRQPEGDRFWIGVGASANTRYGVFDFGYLRGDVDDVLINNTIPLAASSGLPASVFGDTLRGEYVDTSVNFVGIQFRRSWQ